MPHDAVQPQPHLVSTNGADDSLLNGLRVTVATHCPVCKYSLEGLPQKHTCPECGFVYEPDMLILGKPAKRGFLRYLSWGILGLSVASLVVINVVAAMYGHIGKLALMSLVFFAQLAIFAISTKNWAIVRSDGIVWRALLHRDRFVAWRDIVAVRSAELAPFLVIRRVNGRSMRELCGIINREQPVDVRDEILRTLSNRWAAALVESGVATVVSPMPKSDAVTFRRESGLKDGHACPGCREQLHRTGDRMLTCTDCVGLFRDEAIVRPYVKRPIPPWHWLSLIVAGMVFWAGFISTKETYYSLSTAIVVGTIASSIFLGIFTWNFFRFRSPLLLTIDETGITWTQQKGAKRQWVWDTVNTIVCAPDLRVICLRLADGGIEAVPDYFFRKHDRVHDMARYMAALCGRANPD